MNRRTTLASLTAIGFLGISGTAAVADPAHAGSKVQAVYAFDSVHQTVVRVPLSGGASTTLLS